MKTKRYFPMFIDLSDKNVVVVGGGNIATRRVKTLLQFTRNVTAIAPKVTEELRGLGTAGYDKSDYPSCKAFGFSDGIYDDRSYQ